LPADPTVSITCTVTGTAVAGQYENVADVSANSAITPEVVVLDSDPSHYFGVDASISLVKTTNGEDANTPEEAPLVPLGGPVIWRYFMTNTGNVPLVWSLVDNPSQGLACPRLLSIAPGQTIACRAVG